MKQQAIQFIPLFLLNTFLLSGTAARQQFKAEQTDFSVEQDLVPVTKPTGLPDEALRVLAKDPGVLSCLRNDELSLHRAPASWFVASQIHLGPHESDFVVLPNLNAGEDRPGSAACFLGANTGQFWIIRKITSDYEVALSTFAHSLTVLKTRSNGLRDVETATVSVSQSTHTFFKFDGTRYLESETKTLPNQ